MFVFVCLVPLCFGVVCAVCCVIACVFVFVLMGYVMVVCVCLFVFMFVVGWGRRCVVLLCVLLCVVFGLCAPVYDVDVL